MAEEANDRAKRMEEAEARAWAAIERLDEKRAKLDQLLVILAEAQRRTDEARGKWLNGPTAA